MAVRDNPRIFYWARFFENFNLLIPVLSLFYLHRGLQISDLLLLFVIDVVFSLIFEIPTGVFADKYGHKASLIVSELIRILGLLLLFVAFEKWIFYIIAALTGISVTFHSGVKDALIYESLKEVKKQKTFSKVWGKIDSAMMLSAAIAALFGAYLAKDLQEWQFILLICIGLFFALVRLVFLFRLTTPKSHEITKHIKSFDQIKESITFLRKTPILFWMVVGQMFIYIPFWGFKEVAQPFLKAAQFPVAYFGILYAITYGLIYLALHKIDWLESKASKKSLIIYISVGNLLIFLIAAFAGTYMHIAVLIFIASYLLRRLRGPIFSHIRHEYIPSRNRSTVGSLLSGLDSLFDIFIIGTLSGLAKISLPAVFLGAAAFVFIGLFFPLKLKSEIKNKHISPR